MTTFDRARVRALVELVQENLELAQKYMQTSKMLLETSKDLAEVQVEAKPSEPQKVMFAPVFG